MNDNKKEFVTVNNLKRFLQNADERFAPNKNMEGIKSDGSGGYIAGKSGLVPAPPKSSNGKFLRSDGTWAAPGESSVYNTMDVAEGTAGTSTTDRVINAKNLKEIISSQVPTKVSELDNDSNFLTSSELTSHTSNKNIHVTSTEKTTWNNKQNALTSQQINNINAVPDKANASELTSHTDDTDIHVTPTEKTTWNNKANKATTLSGYGITDAYTKTQVDKKVSDLVNSAPETLDTLNELANALGNDPNFATTVANQIGTKANTSDLSAVATSGSYNDLSDKPTIPKVNNATLTIQKNGTTVKTFTANSSTNVTANITVPTKTSELTNDSGFLTSHNPVDSSLSSTSTNAIQNKVVNAALNNKANDSAVVHRSGNETIAGVKTFSDVTYSNKELRYKDTKYDWTNTSLDTWCDAGHVSWSDKTGKRRMHELVGTKGGVWQKVCYINEQPYFSVNSNRDITYWGATIAFNGTATFTSQIKGNISGNADTVDGSHAWQMQTLSAGGQPHGSADWLLQCQYNVDGDNYFKLYCGDKSIRTKVDRAGSAGYADYASRSTNDGAFYISGYKIYVG